MKVIVQDLSVEYQDEGSGKTILFLHGWQDSLHSFDLLTQHFRGESVRLVRLDLPGFGQSESPKTDWSLSDYIVFVGSFIGKLNLTPDVLVGHSFGGRIAIRGVASKELSTDKLILISSAGIARKFSFRNLAINLLTKILALITYIPPLIFWRDRIKVKAYKIIGSDYLNAGKLKQTFLQVIKEDLRKYASQITQQTLLIWGENDIETPVLYGQIFSELIPNSHLEIIASGGHFVHKEKPVEVSVLIKKFI
jgi:pimeloyl-ACP methyl ester carboxylesterase